MKSVFRIFIIIFFGIFSCCADEVIVFSGSVLLQNSVIGKQLLKDVEKKVAELEMFLKNKRIEFEQAERLFFEHKEQCVTPEESQRLALELHALLEQQESLKKDVESVDSQIELLKVGMSSNLLHEIVFRYQPFYNYRYAIDLDQGSVLHADSRIDFTNVLLHELNNAIVARGKTYRTEDKFKELFRAMGVVYLDSNNVELVPFVSTCDVQKSDFYRANQESLFRFQELYADDIAKKTRASLYVAWIDDLLGWGVFADAFIPKGSFVQEYIGVLRNAANSYGLAAGDTAYAWCYPLLNGVTLYLDSKYQGNQTRYVNHSDDPNLTKIIVLGHDNAFHICYVAAKDISINEELTVDYGSAYWSTRKNCLEKKA